MEKATWYFVTTQQFITPRLAFQPIHEHLP
jgi:hypothetical protein